MGGKKISGKKFLNGIPLSWARNISLFIWIACFDSHQMNMLPFCYFYDQKFITNHVSIYFFNLAENLKPNLRLNCDIFANTLQLLNIIIGGGYLFFGSFWFFLFCLHHGIWKILGQELNLSCSFNLHHSCSNAISLTHCSGLGMKPMPPWWHKQLKSDF